MYRFCVSTGVKGRVLQREKERDRENARRGWVIRLHLDILKEDRNKPVYFFVSDKSHNCSPQRQGSDLKSVSTVECDTSFMLKEEFRPKLTFHVDIREKMLALHQRQMGSKKRSDPGTSASLWVMEAAQFSDLSLG